MTDNVTSKEKQKENQQSKIRGFILVKNKQSLLRPFWVNQLKLSKRKKNANSSIAKSVRKEGLYVPTHIHKKKKKRKRKRKKEKKRKEKKKKKKRTRKQKEKKRKNQQ